MSTITLAGTGGLFTRLGKEATAYLDVIGFIGTAAPSSSVSWSGTLTPIVSSYTAILGIDSQFLAAQQPVRDGLWANLTNIRSAVTGYLSSISTFASNAVVAQAIDAAPLVDPTLQGAWTQVVKEMVASTQSISSNACSVTIAADSANTGNPTVIGSVKGPDGVNLQRVYPEAAVLVVTDDYQRNATLGSEPFTLSGLPFVGPTSWNWPQGSGMQESLTMTDPTLNGNRNLLYNSDFNDFTVANTPDRWTATVGTFGTTLLDGGAATGYMGGKSLKILGDGAQLTATSQLFAATGTAGTSSRLLPLQVYAVCGFVKMNITPSTGVLAISLTNGATDAVITNDAGTAQTVSKDLTTVSTTYVAVSGFFQTPHVMPSTAKIKVHLTTAIENTKFALVSDMALVNVTPLYQAGPYVAIFEGSTPVTTGDKWTVTFANDLAGKFQTFVWRVFGSEIPQTPTAVSPTIPDSLIS